MMRQRGQYTQEGKEVEADSQDRKREVQGGERLDDAHEGEVKRSRTEDGPVMDIDTLEDRDRFHRQASLMGWSDDQGRWLMAGPISREDQERVMEELNRISRTMKACGPNSSQVMKLVSEVYSPHRINSVVDRMGLVPGFSLDLTTVDPGHNRPWGFICQGKNKARRIVRARSS
jgi:hypothetical protein